MSHTDVAAKLERCFAAVFPALPPDGIRTAQADQVAEWDSMATVTLTALVNEEFGCDLDLDQMEPMRSFEALRHFLEASGAAHG